MYVYSSIAKSVRFLCVVGSLFGGIALGWQSLGLSLGPF